MHRIDHDAAIRRPPLLASIARPATWRGPSSMAAVPVARTARTVMRDVAVLLRGEHRRLLSAKLDMADVAFDVLLETGILIFPLPIWRDEGGAPGEPCQPRLAAQHRAQGDPVVRTAGRRPSRRMHRWRPCRIFSA
ncbi:DNA polymerase III subunit beta [Verminephrobacter eiseniae]|uniref:DNA polymerase III subunit beta n=1 Tax=Verminephrobacter eiseniae TaxID=364317 RepID=UPI001E2E7130|nr:DNA polymerase III subunit beta [Verminephrobacter eiseniae]